MNQHKRQSLPRGPLEWEVLTIYVGEKPTLDPNLPDHVRARLSKLVACQVSIASAGFDRKNQVDRVKFSYCLGWMEDDGFHPAKNLPDERITDFMAILSKASSESKAHHMNTIKKVQGALTQKVMR